MARRHDTGDGRLPGIRGSADRFGRHSVTTKRARPTGGGGGGSSNNSSSSSRAAVAPHVRRHAPSAKTRRRASATLVRTGHGLTNGFS